MECTGGPVNYADYSGGKRVVVNENRTGMFSQSFSKLDEISLISHFGLVWTCFVSRPVSWCLSSTTALGH